MNAVEEHERKVISTHLRNYDERPLLFLLAMRTQA
jgi:hypothetical protein